MVRMHYVLVTGSAELSKHLVEFTRALGRRIMMERDLVLVTGGLKQFTRDVPTADYEVVQGAMEQLKALHEDPGARILTFVPEEEYALAERFHEGEVRVARRSNLRSRRYAMVYASDAIIAIEGHRAVRENIDLAWILNKPLLPVPCTGGNAKEAWDRYGEELRPTLRIGEDEAEILESGLDDPCRLANCCLTVLRRTVRTRCFVAMRFEAHPASWAYGVMEDVVRKKGYEPVRVDKVAGGGNIVDMIWSGIRSSDAFVADITGNSPNVFYELGIAHALRKDVVILLYDPSGKLPKDAPFDIGSHRISVYADEKSLRAVLERDLDYQDR